MTDSTNIIKEPKFKIIISIPDCFVSPYLKLANGKNGHGERRLYTGDNDYNNNYICNKPWKILFPDEYKTSISNILFDTTLFSKQCIDRQTMVYNSIDICSEKLIYINPQNGTKDVSRYYVGPNKNNKENIKLYDTFRCTVIPKMYSLQLIENDDYFECNIIKNELIEKTSKTKKSSNACIEWLKYLSMTYCIEIQHEFNKGEFQLRNPLNGYFWPVDGYHNCKIHECSGNLENPCKYNNNIWEFQGDYFHGNPKKYNKDDTFHGISYSNKYDKDLAKQLFYEENGYIVNVKWESEWVEEKKNLKKNNIKWY